MIRSTVCDNVNRFSELPYLSKTSTFPQIWITPRCFKCETDFPVPVERWPPWVWFAAFAHKCQTSVLCLLVVLQASPASKWNMTRLTFIWFDSRARLSMLCQTRHMIILPVALFTFIHIGVWLWVLMGAMICCVFRKHLLQTRQTTVIYCC